jgi:hypothetical protein
MAAPKNFLIFVKLLFDKKRKKIEISLPKILLISLEKVGVFNKNGICIP